MRGLSRSCSPGRRRAMSDGKTTTTVRMPVRGRRKPVPAGTRGREAEKAMYMRIFSCEAGEYAAFRKARRMTAGRVCRE
jgi:hypothetical protein